MQTGARALDAMELAHSYGDDCLHCGDGKPGTRCDLQGYSARRVRFIRAHLEAYRSAYLNPNRSAASHEMERLEREYRTLPPRHSCTCPRRNPRTGITEYHCFECRRLGENIPKQDVAVVIGRTSPVVPPMPSPVMLDLARADAVLGPTDDAAAIARYMSRDGVVIASVAQRKTAITTELVCLLCARPGVSGQRSCHHCGGSLILEPVVDVA